MASAPPPPDKDADSVQNVAKRLQEWKAVMFGLDQASGRTPVPVASVGIPPLCSPRAAHTPRRPRSSGAILWEGAQAAGAFFTHDQGQTFHSCARREVTYFACDLSEEHEDTCRRVGIDMIPTLGAATALSRVLTR